jgi:hypothetical protein
VNAIGKPSAGERARVLGFRVDIFVLYAQAFLSFFVFVNIGLMLAF